MTTNVAMRSATPASGPSEFDLGYDGWRVALAACLGVMGGFGSLFVYTFTVFVKPLGAEYGWNRESVSLGFAIAAMTVGVSSPVIGRLLDRLIVTGWLLDRFFGARVALVVSLVTAAGIFMLARANGFTAGCCAAALIGVGAGAKRPSHPTC